MNVLVQVSLPLLLCLLTSIGLMIASLARAQWQFNFGTMAYLFVSIFLYSFAFLDQSIPTDFVSNFYWYLFFCLFAFWPLTGVLLRKLISDSDGLPIGIIYDVFAVSSALGAIGVIGTIMTPESTRSIGLATGLITIFYFFSSFSKIAALSLIFMIRRGYSFRVVDYFGVAVVLLYYYDFILYLGKRTGMFEVLMLLYIYYYGRMDAKRVIILGVVAACVIGLSLFVQQVRLYTKHNVPIEQLISQKREVTVGTPVEVEHAIYIQAASSKYGDNVLNLSKIWNNVISVLIPGQIVGEQLKKAMYLDEGKVDLSEVNYRARTGSASFFTAELYNASSFIGPPLLFLFSFFLFKKFMYGGVVSIYSAYSFLFAMPYLINFGFMNFSFYFIRIILVVSLVKVIGIPRGRGNGR